MQFNKKTHKVHWTTLTKGEAKAFIVFLESERDRHIDDVKDIERIITEVKHWFSLEDSIGGEDGTE